MGLLTDLLGDGNATSRQLAYAESTAAQTNAGDWSSAPVDITGCAITFTAGTRPIEIEFMAGFVRSNTAGAGVCVVIRDAGGTELLRPFVDSGAANQKMALIGRRRLTTLTPGQSYTLTARFGSLGGGTATMGADPVYPTSLKATEVG